MNKLSPQTTTGAVHTNCVVRSVVVYCSPVELSVYILYSISYLYTTFLLPMRGAGAGREILRGFLLPASRAAVCAARIRSRKRTSAASSAVRERRGRDTPPATPPGPSCGGGGGAAEARAHSRHAATRERRAAVILQLCIRSTFGLEKHSRGGRGEGE